MKPIKFEDILLFENDNYLIINKPPYVSTLDDRTMDKDVNILRLAKKYCADAQVCHRLDKETSGALAIAKNPEAYRHLSMRFENRQVEKIYHAITNGVHDLKNVNVFLPIAVLPKGIGKIDYAEGKEAETFFDTIEVFKKNTLVACRPVTGRLHQIRIHLSCLKASIVADLQYGGRYLYLSEIKRDFKLKRNTEEEPLIKRVALHAQALVFEDMNGETIRTEAPYPKDIAAVLNQLRINK